MKISRYAIFLVIFGGFQLRAAQPLSIKTDSQATESDWIFVSPKANNASEVTASKKSLQKMAYKVVLQICTAQINRLKAELAQAQAGAVKMQDGLESVAQAQLDQQREGHFTFQNDPSRYGLFYWEQGVY